MLKLGRALTHPLAVGVTTLALGMGLGSLPVRAQETCIFLRAVGGGQTEVTKTVSIPSFLINSTNWNTDWAIPGGDAFDTYIVTIALTEAPADPEDTVETTRDTPGAEAADAAAEIGPAPVPPVDISMSFKYSDGSAERAFTGNGTVLQADAPTVIEAAPLRREPPAQVNVFVGGLRASGIVTYTAVIQACR